MKTKTISLNIKQATKIICQLEFLVVSLDRIGSLDATSEGFARNIRDFVVQEKVFKNELDTPTIAQPVPMIFGRRNSFSATNAPQIGAKLAYL